MRRAAAVMLALLLLALPAGCAAGTAGDPYDFPTTVGLSDGRIVDCADDFGIACDWTHPRRPGPGETADRQVLYYRVGGRVVPCARGVVNGLTCDFTRGGESS